MQLEDILYQKLTIPLMIYRPMPEKMWTEKHLPAVPGVQVDNNGLEILEIAHIYIEQLNDKIEQLTKRLMAMESMILQNLESAAGK